MWKLHASHVIPKKTNKLHRWSRANVITLCCACHLEWWHKDPIDAALWFMTKHPELHRYLLTLRKRRKKYTIEERKKLIAWFREEMNDR